MTLKNIFINNTHDCLTCALRPAILFGFPSFIAQPECPHTNPKLNQPEIKQNKLVTATYLVVNSFILLGLGTSIYELASNDDLDFRNTFKYAVLVMKFVNSTVFSVTLYINQRDSITSLNVLVDTIDKRELYGIETILTTKITKFLHFLSLLLTCTASVFLSVYFFESIWSIFTIRNVILTSAFTIRTFNYVNYAILGSMSIVLYWLCLDTCYKQVEDILNKRNNTSDRLQQLRYMQQFYLVICRNYKNQFNSFGNVVFYAQELIYGVLMCVQSYFYYAYVKDNGFLQILNANYCEMDNLTVWFGFPFFVWLVATVSDSSQNLTSFLYRYKTNKLSTEEALQVEMFLITLEVEKPILTAANLFTLGINLLAAVSGTAVTYVLVALQFNASNSVA